MGGVRWALGLLVLTSCKDPITLDTSTHGSASTDTTSVPESCPASEEWLPHTAVPDAFVPLPHPSTECPFYRAAWQNFLVATEADGAHEPAFRAYATIDDLFVSKTPHAPRNTAQRAWLGDIKQAGGREILVAQSGRPIYYGIHVNQAFADFVVENGLGKLEGIQNADPKLFFPSGVVEFKSAWADIEDAPDDYADFITTTAWIPHLAQDPTTHQIREDKDHPRQVKVALLAIHVVFTMPGHPEFVWATFEHTGGDGQPNVAPKVDKNPEATDPYDLANSAVVCTAQAPLCAAGAPVNRGNQALTESELALDEASQSFRGQKTSVYRMFPGSKSNSVDSDAAVASLNANMRALFAKNPGDVRGHYALVGAVWMDKPALFTLDASFQNDAASALLKVADQPDISGNDERRALLAKGVTPAADIVENGADSPFSLLAGEDRLSSVAMESFTQSPAAFPNCFACHNTEAVTARGVPVAKDGSSKKLLDPKLINISHVFSQFVLEESQ